MSLRRQTPLRRSPRPLDDTPRLQTPKPRLRRRPARSRNSCLHPHTRRMAFPIKPPIFTSDLSPDLDLLPYQAAFAANPSRFKIGLWARQTGKDHTTAAEAVLDCLHGAGSPSRSSNPPREAPVF